MNALQIFKHGLKLSLRKPGSIFATILILIVPVMYPLFWLQAFWNPYENIGNLPVAFVNEDFGAYGAGLEQHLRGSTDVKWSFPGRKAADSGLKERFVDPGRACGVGVD
ncbi:YhgE/Pip domain-containing protein [Treponema primitia]|uniref:YhgE/Pip domain-containing protein n=1 Tax=Treponema primitia TaxID=88058 RepID=UPI0002554FAA|nr:phage infection protein [Treponema primitia]